MKFKISVPDFQYAMRLVKDVVPSSGPLAESTGVLISTEGSRAVFTAFNSELLARATVNIESERDGEAVVSASTLWSAISRFQPRNERGFGTSDITVSKSPKAKKLNISATTRYASGGETPHKRVFSLLNQEFFPDIPNLDSAPNTHTFEIPADKLMEGIDSVSYASSSDKNQALFTGVFMRLEEGKLVLVATNGICLAEYAVPVVYAGEPVSFVLPGGFATKIAKSFFDEDSLRVVVTTSSMFVSTPNLLLGGTLIREEYPDYKAVMPLPTAHAVVNKHILLDNLLNLSYQAVETEDSRVSMVFEGGEAVLRCGGSTNSGLLTDFKGSFGFDCDLKLFSLSVRNIVGENLRIGFSGEGSPLHFSSTETSPTGSTLSCVLVPLA